MNAARQDNGTAESYDFRRPVNELSMLVIVALRKGDPSRLLEVFSTVLVLGSVLIAVVIAIVRYEWSRR